ncbi:hypothetical protein NECAME_00546, partial [Necator americanus]
MNVKWLLLYSAYVVWAVEDDATDVIQETIRYLLDFSEIPNANSSAPSFRASHRTAATMQNIYETLVEDDGSDDGNVVRGIDPALGKLDGHEVLIFDITGLEKEQIMRGELHFYLRRRDATKPGRAKQLRAKSLCINEYCSENQQLQTIRVTVEKVIWDATKPLAEANALGSNQLVVRVTRRDIRMRRYAEIVRKCSPFLLVYSKGENTIDAEQIQKRVDGSRGKRKEHGYFSYKTATETTSEASSTTTQKLSEDMKIFRRHFMENTGQSRKKIRGRRNRSLENDVWNGFGEGSVDEEKQPVKIEKSNDVRVILLEADEKKEMCQKRGSMVDLRLLGWGRWVIAPATFEAGFCSGKCPNPLPK